MHLSGPPLGTPGGPTGPNVKKNDFFLKIAETTIIIRSGALREKQATLQNRGFGVLDPPWSAPEAEPVPPGPPERPKGHLGGLGVAQNPPRGAQEPSMNTSNSQKLHTENLGNMCILPSVISKKSPRTIF